MFAGNENVPQIDYVGWSHDSINLPIIKLYSSVDECIVHASCLSEVVWFKKESNRGGHGAIVALSTHPTGSLVATFCSRTQELTRLHPAPCGTDMIEQAIVFFDSILPLLSCSGAP